MLVDKIEVRYHTLYGFDCRGLFAKADIKVRLDLSTRSESYPSELSHLTYVL
jgi:hypothetical protein